MILHEIESKRRIRSLLDTCHSWDVGYNFKNNLDKVLDDFDKTIGLNYLKDLHINDSLNELNSNKDRHANMGKGFIGLDAMKKIIRNKHLINLPKALETPNKEMDLNIWKNEIIELRKN